MIKLAAIVGVAVAILSVFGCHGKTAVGIERLESASGVPVTERVDPVTNTGREAGVLSLHRRTTLPDSCTYELTLTNNVRTEVKDIILRFTAYDPGGVRLDHTTGHFFGIKPTQNQSQEISFPFTCDRIAYLEVSDPDGCVIGDVTRKNAKPGDCIKHIDIAHNPYVRLVTKSSASN